MSKERARRRAEREREAAVKAAARAAEAERRERKAARTRALRRHTTDRMPRLSPTGRDTGALAHRRRVETSMLLAMLVAINVLVWVIRPDAQARVGVLVVSALAFPVLHVLLLPRR